MPELLPPTSIILDSPSKLPPDLIHRVSNSQNIILYVQYGDELQCSLHRLATCPALKLGLINRECLHTMPHLASNAQAFDYYIYYDGPNLDNQDFGNIKWLDEKKKKKGSEKLRDKNGVQILIPETHEAITAVMDQILPHVQNKDSFHLVAQNEEVLLDTAFLREFYGLKLGLSSKMTEFFIDKVAQKDFYARNNMNIPETWIVNTVNLVKMLHNGQLPSFLDNQKIRFPILAKPVTGAGAYETFTIDNFGNLEKWLENSENYTYDDFLFQEKLHAPQYMSVVIKTNDDVIIPHVSKSTTLFCDFVQYGCKINETHLSKGDPEFEEVSQFSKESFLKCSKLGRLETGSYFVEAMRKADGSLATTEIQCRYPAGFYVTSICEDMYGLDVESWAIAWPFLGDFTLTATPERVQYKHATVVVYPTLGGKVLANLKPDPALFLPGSRSGYIHHMFQIGVDVPPHPLSIVHVLAELCVVGDNREAVDQTADILMEKFYPCKLKMS